MELPSLMTSAEGHFEEMLTLRRGLHEWPEIGNHLPATRAMVLDALGGMPLDVTLHETTSGIAALLDGAGDGPTVLLRADMDALPLAESTGLQFASKNAGLMHACGHDAHAAMLVGAVKLLSTRRAQLAGRVLFMFQPGEEGSHGAKRMLEEGLLDVPKRRDGSESPVTGAYALHLTTSLPTGTLGSRGGPLLAAADSVLITVTGRGGHGGLPHRALDPIPIACEIVQALQTMITRRVDVFDPAVVTIGRITAGTAANIVPERAELEGTIRAVSEDTRRAVHVGIRRVAEGIAAAHGATVSVEFHEGYPVTVNDTSRVDAIMAVAAALVGPEKTQFLDHPRMATEDFSYVLQEVPGAMVFLGATPEGQDAASAAPNHSSHVVFDEDAMVTGAAMYAAMALTHLDGEASDRPTP